MPGFNLPEDKGSLVANVEGGPSRATGSNADGAFAVANIGAPQNDAAAVPQKTNDDRKPGHFQPDRDQPVDYVSVPTMVTSANQFGTNLATDLHDTNYLDRTKPYVSPESQASGVIIPPARPYRPSKVQ